MNCHMSSEPLPFLAEDPTHPPPFASEGLELMLSDSTSGRMFHSNHGNAHIRYLFLAFRVL